MKLLLAGIAAANRVLHINPSEQAQETLRKADDIVAQAHRYGEHQDVLGDLVKKMKGPPPRRRSVTKRRKQ